MKHNRVSDPVAMTVEAVEGLIKAAGGETNLITPRGWPHLGLVIIDAVFSLQADYDTVVRPLLARYCDAAPDLSWATASDPPRPEHDAQRLIDFLGAMSLERRFTILNKNVGPGTWRGSAGSDPKGKAKAEIVVDIAEILTGQDKPVVTRADFVEVARRDATLEGKVRKVPGVGFACWQYLLNLSGVEVSKPDTMVMRWLCQVTGASVGARDGAALIEDATGILHARGSAVTVRQIDHLVWRKASGRPLGRNQGTTTST